MNPTRLAIVAALIGAAVRLVKSEAINGLLAKLGLKPLPKTSLPWLALALGAGSGVVQALLDHVALASALPNILDGLVSGALAVGGHESLSAVAPKVIGVKAANKVFGTHKPAKPAAVPPAAVPREEPAEPVEVPK